MTRKVDMQPTETKAGFRVTVDVAPWGDIIRLKIGDELHMFDMADSENVADALIQAANILQDRQTMARSVKR